MAGSVFQLLDLRSKIAKLASIRNGSIESITEFDAPWTQMDEDQWLGAFHEFLANEFPKSKAPVDLLLPNKFVLYKSLAVPSVGVGNSLENVLKYEVEQAFPHDAGDLSWNYCLLGQDEVEAVCLVGGIRYSLYEKLRTAFAANALTLESAYPSLSIEINQLEASEISPPDAETLVHSVFVEPDYSTVVSRLGTEVKVRGVKLDPEADEQGPEIKRLGATLKRSFPTATKSSLAVVALQDTSDAFVQTLAHNLAVRDLSDAYLMTSTIDSAAQTIISRSNPKLKDPFNRLRLAKSEESNTAGEDKHAFAKLCIIASLLVLSPFLVFAGNQLKQTEQKQVLRELQRSAQISKNQTDALNGKLIELEAKYHEALEAKRLSKLNKVYVNLLSDIQTVLVDIKDIWVDELDIDLETEGPCVLKLSGRFLIKKTNLSESERISVIQDAKMSLDRFRNLLSQTGYIEDFSDFSVNYEAIAQGINVVPFSVKAPLAAPFNGEGGDQ